MKSTSVKWHQLSPEESVRQQNSNAVSGLDPKTARLRLRRNGYNTLFDSGSSVSAQLWRSFFVDPSLWLMLLALLLCFFFSEIAAGIASAILFGGSIVVCGMLIYRAQSMENKVSELRIPTACVLRDGKKLRISAREVVVGDLIYLEAGDIVPCDCRLLRADECFQCLTVYPDKDGKPIRKKLPKHPLTVYPYKAQQFAPFFENMLYGTSEILSGSAYALAVETGVRTFCGAMNVYRAVESPPTSDSYADTVAPYLRAYSLLSYVVIIPILVIGFFTAPKDTSLLRIFTPLCALLAGGSRAVLSLLFRSIGVRTAEQLYHCTPIENRAILKGNHTEEALSSVTDLIVLGSCASSDGNPRLFRCAVGTGELSLKTSQPLLRPLTEAYWLLSHTNGSEEEGDADGCLQDLTKLCKIDPEAIRIRILSSNITGRSPESRMLDVRTAETAYRLVFFHGNGMIHHCTSYENAEGRMLPLSEEQQQTLQQFVESTRADGCRIVTVVKQMYRRTILLGVVALREQMQALLPSALEEFRQCGVHVSFFLEGSLAECRQYAAAAGLSEVAPMASLPQEPEALLRCYAKHRVYAGIDRREILTLVQTLRRAKRRVAVLGNQPEDLAVLSAASMSIACDALIGASADKASNRSSRATESPAKNTTACPTVRAHADLLICRAGALAGGIPAILQAFSYVRAAKLRARLLLRYLTGVHLMRWCICAITLLFGIGFPNTLQLLYGGIALDLFAFFWILQLPMLQSKLRKRPRFDPPTVMHCLSDKSLWLPSIVSSSVIALITVLLGRFGVFSNAVAVSVIFASLLITQILILYLYAFRSGYPLLGTVRLLPVGVLLLAALVLLAALLQPAVASVTELGAWNLAGVLVVPLLPLLVLLLTSVFSHIRRSSAK